MDKSSIPTHAGLFVTSPAQSLIGYRETHDIEFADIQAVQIQHCKSNNRNSDHLVYVKTSDRPEAVEIGHEINGSSWKGFKWHHTVDMMRKAGAEVIEIPETSFKDSRRIYDSSMLVVRLDAIKRIVADPAAPNTQSLIEREGRAPIPVLAPMRDVTAIPALARFKHGALVC